MSSRSQRGIWFIVCLPVLISFAPNLILAGPQWRVVEKLPSRHWSTISLDANSKDTDEVRPPTLTSSTSHGRSTWVVGEGGTIVRTTDDGQTWNTLEPIPNADLQTVFFLDDHRGWTAGSRQKHGVIFQARDAGESWTLQHEVQDFRLSSVNAIIFSTALEGWAVGNAENTGARELGFILHTMDGGMHWRLQYKRQDVDGFRALRFVNEREGWVLGTSDIIHTSDGGRTWQAQHVAALDSPAFSLDFVSASEGWIVGGIQSGQLLHTTDAGVTWSNVSPNLRDQARGRLFYYSVEFASPTQGWIGASDGIVLSTTDGGRNWTVEQTGTSQAIRSMCLSRGTLFAASVDGVISSRSLP